MDSTCLQGKGINVFKVQSEIEVMIKKLDVTSSV
jgi:hypothetical protein